MLSGNAQSLQLQLASNARLFIWKERWAGRRKAAASSARIGFYICRRNMLQ
jgi:hypothetical protein